MRRQWKPPGGARLPDWASVSNIPVGDYFAQANDINELGNWIPEVLQWNLEGSERVLTQQSGATDNVVRFMQLLLSICYYDAGVWSNKLQQTKVKLTAEESSNNRMTSRVKELEAEVDTLNQQQRLLDQNLLSVQRENGDLRNTKESLSTELKMVQAQLNAARDEVDEALSERATKDKENEDLRRKMVQKIQEQKKLFSDHAQEAGDVRMLFQQNRELHDRVIMLQRELEAMETKYEAVKARNDEAEQQISDLGGQVSGMEEDLATLEDEKNRTLQQMELNDRKALKDLQTFQDMLSRAEEDLQVELDNERNERSALTLEVERLNAELDLHRKQYGAKAVQQLEKEVIAKEREIENLKLEMHAHMEHNSNVPQVLSGRLEGLDGGAGGSRMAMLVERNTDLQQRVETLLTSNSDLEKELEELQKELSSAKRTMHNMRGGDAMRVLTTQLSDLERDYGQLKQENEKLKLKSTYAEDLLQTCNALADLCRQLGVSDDDIETLKVHTEAVGDELTDAHMHMARLRKDIMGEFSVIRKEKERLLHERPGSSDSRRSGGADGSAPHGIAIGQKIDGSDILTEILHTVRQWSGNSPPPGSSVGSDAGSGSRKHDKKASKAIASEVASMLKTHNEGQQAMLASYKTAMEQLERRLGDQFGEINKWKDRVVAIEREKALLLQERESLRRHIAARRAGGATAQGTENQHKEQYAAAVPVAGGDDPADITLDSEVPLITGDMIGDERGYDDM